MPVAERTSRLSTTGPNGRNLVLFGFELTPTGLRVANEGRAPKLADYENLGVWLSETEKAIQWWIGDYVNFGESLYGERAAQAVDATGWQEDTVKQCAWVASRVPPSRRDPDLSFSHHREVADLPPREQTRWLAKAKEGEDGARWSVDKLRRQLKAAKNPTADEKTVWLLVGCQGQKACERLMERLQREGYTVKVSG